MDTIEKALRGALQQTIQRLNDLGGAVVFEDYPGPLADEGQGESGGDAVSIGEERELTFAIRDRLMERAIRLGEALDRLRSGDYGTCEVCGEPIAPARLRVIPEVTTCVACQEAQEHGARGVPERAAAR